MTALIIVIFVIAILAVPAVLIGRLTAAKRRENAVGAPSTFTHTPDEVPDP